MSIRLLKRSFAAAAALADLLVAVLTVHMISALGVTE